MISVKLMTITCTRAASGLAIAIQEAYILASIFKHHALSKAVNLKTHFSTPNLLSTDSGVQLMPALDMSSKVTFWQNHRDGMCSTDN